MPGVQIDLGEGDAWPGIRDWRPTSWYDGAHKTVARFLTTAQYPVG